MGRRRVAVHELLHPPWPSDQPVKGLLDRLAADPFLAARFARRDPAAGWTTADDGMHVLALLLYDTLQRGDFDPAGGTYADFLARALSDGQTWPVDLQARYLELTATA